MTPVWATWSNQSDAALCIAQWIANSRIGPHGLSAALPAGPASQREPGRCPWVPSTVVRIVPATSTRSDTAPKTSVQLIASGRTGKTGDLALPAVEMELASGCG